MANIIATLENKNGDTIYPVAGAMAGDSVTTAMVQDDAITNDKIANNAVKLENIDFTTFTETLWETSGSSGIQPTSESPITLSDDISNYDYIEVTASNNASGNQGKQVFKFTTDTPVISINFYHMLANNVYIRSTRYSITNGTTVAEQGSAYQNQCTITTGPSVTFQNGSDGIYLWKIIGYKF